MRRAGTLVLLLALVAPARAHAVAPDWVVARFTAGPDGAVEPTVSLIGEVVADGRAPVLVGLGVGTASRGWVDVIPAGGGPVRVTTTAGAGGLSLTLLPGGPGGGTTGSIVSFGGSLPPGGSIAILVFVTGGAFDSFAPGAYAERGSLDASVETGTGSAHLPAADPGDAGVAAGVGPAAAGWATHAGRLGTGVAGGFALFDFCVVCSGTWRGPDGGERTWRSRDLILSGEASGALSFAGPAGDWSWSWSGAGSTRSFVFPGSAPAFGAYAPVGDDWALFD